MKAPRGGGWSNEPRSSRRFTVFLPCILLIPLYFLYGTRTNITQSIGVNLQLASIGKGGDREEVSSLVGGGHENLSDETPGMNIADDLNGEESDHVESQSTNRTTQGATGEQDLHITRNDVTNQGTSSNSNSSPKGDSWIECDFSGVRTDVCEIRGDVRVHGPSSSVVLVLPSSSSSSSSTSSNINNSNSNSNSNSKFNTSIKIRPYARKWEGLTMSQIGEMSLIRYSTAPDVPDQSSAMHMINNKNSSKKVISHCSVSYSSPAIVFSTGGFRDNFFHEIADALIPLFLTSYRFRGDVHFLVEDFSSRWFHKYHPILRRLSRHDVVNLDVDRRVHCFNRVVLGLNSTMELGIDPAKSPLGGPSMLDFKALLRESFMLPREFVFLNKENNDKNEKKKKKLPRLLFLSRKGSRVLTNEREVIEMVRGFYEVVTVGPETTRNITLMARIVNSCDVLMGVHGAGLTNMLFLPTNATLIQIIPWGEMLHPCRYTYGDPAIGMGLRYVEYEISMNESSLIKKYPKDHVVLRDPLSVHKKGFSAIWSIFLHQDITLHLGRFRDFFLSTALPTGAS